MIWQIMQAVMNYSKKCSCVVNAALNSSEISKLVNALTFPSALTLIL